jgi:hypothetical protein
LCRWNNAAAQLAYRIPATHAAGNITAAAVGEDAIIAARNAGFVVLFTDAFAFVFVVRIVFTDAFIFVVLIFFSGTFVFDARLALSNCVIGLVGIVAQAPPEVGRSARSFYFFLSVSTVRLSAINIPPCLWGWRCLNLKFRTSARP